jgi:hypothetical protein
LAEAALSGKDGLSPFLSRGSFTARKSGMGILLLLLLLLLLTLVVVSSLVCFLPDFSLRSPLTEFVKTDGTGGRLKIIFGFENPAFLAFDLFGLKGTIRQDWINLRVASLERP